MLKQYSSYYLSIIVAAMALNTYAPCVTALAREFEIAPQDLDWLFSITSLGFLLSVPFCYRYAERVGKDLLVIIGLGLVLISMLTASWLSVLALLGISALLLGQGGGFIEILATAALSDKAPAEQRRSVLNFSQVFFCLGSLSVPVLIGFLLESGMSWRGIFRLISVFAFAVAIIMLPRANHAKVEKRLSREFRFRHLVRDSRFLLLISGMILYVTVEMGFASWVCAYFETELNAPLPLANATLSLFWGGLGLGRLLFSFAHFRINDRHSILLFYIIAIISAIPLVLLDDYRIAMFFVLTLGFGFSIMWPTILTMISKEFPQETDSIFSLAIGSGAIGSFIGAPIVGRVTDLTNSFRIGLSVLFLIMLINIIFFALYPQIQKRTRKSRT